MSEWQPIETAPKDGTRIMLWRGFTDFGRWAEMVIAEWHHDEWQWPAPYDDPSTHSDWKEEVREEGYCASGYDFSHWMPLPNPPATEEETA